ncbi:MAG TPA: sigma-54 dependent transcriptional regulator [Desulfomicrobiaceae bacterium]|nr:sigma-54 dependent transcriptional regulator [Desulfomicrobiaceae bacterium]
MPNILIIDDDDGMRHSLSRVVRRMGHVPVTAGSLAGGRRAATAHAFDAVFLDVMLPDGNGLDLLPELAALSFEPEIVIITGAGDADGAELAITNGAWDYIQKGDSIKKISLALERALEYRQQRRKAARICPVTVLHREGIVGDSPQIRACLELTAQAAASDAGVLITGMTGTGKELFARAIHDNSRRSSGPFVTVDCASLPETLAEGLLFGHRKGSFTGAEQDSPGLVMQAAGGTLFLDEIGELPLNLQKGFLRVLQEHRVRPLGGREEIPCDFRLVAATNRDLEDMVEQGEFRSDLLFRVRAFSLKLPRLAERTEDIVEICAYQLGRICRSREMEVKGVSADFFEVLESYDWPGNVRELVQALEYGLAVAGVEPLLFPKHLPPRIRARVATARIVPPESEAGQARGEDGPWDSVASMPPLQEYRDQVCSRAEKRYLEFLIRGCAGKVGRACEVSGLSQSRLYTLLRKYGLSMKEGGT